jgi:hypothetical protein
MEYYENRNIPFKPKKRLRRMERIVVQSERGANPLHLTQKERILHAKI